MHLGARLRCRPSRVTRWYFEVASHRAAASLQVHGATSVGEEDCRTALGRPVVQHLRIEGIKSRLLFGAQPSSTGRVMENFQQCRFGAQANSKSHTLLPYRMTDPLRPHHTAVILDCRRLGCGCILAFCSRSRQVVCQSLRDT